MRERSGTDTTETLRMSIYASLLAALMAAGSYLIIPIGPVPIVLQNLFVLLSGLLLGWKWGLVSVSLYLLLGVIGLPVFSGGSGGIGHLMGPTGGYLLSYLPAVAIIGLISRLGRGKTRIETVLDVTALILGSIVIYVCGFLWLAWITGLSLNRAVYVGVIPFLPGDGIKIAVALVVARFTRPIIRSLCTTLAARKEATPCA